MGLSVFIRMQELDNKKIVLPEGCYAGEYIKDLAIKAKKHFKDKFPFEADFMSLFNVFFFTKGASPYKTTLTEFFLRAGKACFTACAVPS